MMILSKIILLFLVFTINTSYSTGYISEIVNNTDIQLVLEVSEIGTYAGRGFNNIQIVAIDLSTNERKAPYIVNNASSITFLPRTKSIITDVEVPRTKIDLQGERYSIKLSNKGLHGEQIRCLIGFRQFVDLLQITYKEFHSEIRDIIINGAKIKVEEASPSLVKTTGVKIIDGTHYSIEVNQVTKEIEYKNVSGFDFVLNKIEPPTKTSVQFATSAKAIIKSFAPGTLEYGVGSASIGFEKQTTAEFFKKFLKLVQENEYLRNIATIFADDRSQTISLQFYTDITRGDFQKILDKLNLVVK